MRAIEASVRVLLAAAQADRKEKLCLVDTVFQVGDRVLLRTKELLDAADIGKLRLGGTVPSRCSPARAPTPAPSRCHVACAAARPSAPTASNPSLSVSGPRRPRGPSPTRDRRASTGGAAAQPPPGARSHALTGALAGSNIHRRRVAARGGAGSLPRQGPASSCGSPVADYVPAAPRRRAGRWDTPPLLPAAEQPTPPSPLRPPPPAARGRSGQLPAAHSR